LFISGDGICIINCMMNRVSFTHACMHQMSIKYRHTQNSNSFCNAVNIVLCILKQSSRYKPGPTSCITFPATCSAQQISANFWQSKRSTAALQFSGAVGALH
jgi:hypothetical protein